jgi:hypothetical protein
MIVHLTDLDTYEIAWEASGRTNFARGNGIKNTKRDGNRTDYQIDREGVTGEFAVAFALNIPVNTNLRGPDDGHDFVYKGYTIDVKTTRAKYLLFKSVENFKSDVAILVQYLREDLVDIKGVVSKEKFITHHEKKDFGFGEGCALDPSHLTTLGKFINYANRNPKN